MIWYDLFFGGGHPLPFLRDDIEREMAGWSDEELGDLRQHDVDFIDYVLAYEDDEIWPSLLEAHPEQPLEKWWWHLGAIRQREYPAELLPEHLQEIYAEYGS